MRLNGIFAAWVLAGVASACSAPAFDTPKPNETGQRQAQAWPDGPPETRQGNPYDEVAAATGGSVFRMDPEGGDDPALMADLMVFGMDDDRPHARTTVTLAAGREVVAFDVADADKPLGVNVNGLGHGQVHIRRPDGTPVEPGGTDAVLRRYGPDGSIGIFLQDRQPAVGRWTIAVTAPADVTIDVKPAQALVPMP